MTPVMFEAIRFFRIVPPVPSLMTTGFVVVTLASIVAIAIDAALARGTLTTVFVLQAFACSSGFAGHARRGHYDLLITRGERRSTIAAVHWLMSSVPGVLSWLVVSGAEAAATRATGVGFTSGSLVAIAAVSAIAWAVTVPLPRFAGAIGWLVVVLMASAVLPLYQIPRVITAIVYPMALIGGGVGHDPGPALAALSAAIAALVAALSWVEHGDIRLESAQ